MVTMRTTPGTCLARLVSIRLIRPCASVLRNSLAWSMPEMRIVWVYSARPVTFSRPSRRGSERPTCAPTLAAAELSVVTISATHYCLGTAERTLDLVKCGMLLHRERRGKHARNRSWLFADQRRSGAP